MEKGEFIVGYHLRTGLPYRVCESVYDYAKVRDRYLIKLGTEWLEHYVYDPLTINLLIAYYNDKAKFIMWSLLIPFISLGVLLWISGMIIFL